MKAPLVFLAFCLTFGKVLAQERWLKGSVLNEQHQALAYVSLGIAGTSTGTVSRPDGSFRLLLPAEIRSEDSLRVSHLGYETLKLPLAKLTLQPAGELSIVLEPASQQLAPVLIKPTGTRLKILGSRRESTVLKTNFAITGQPFQNLGAGMGKRFNLNGKPHYLKQLNLFVAYNTFDTIVFRLQVHKLKGGQPTENLLHENIYWTLINHRQGWATLDLAPQNLAFEGKVLVSLDWVGHSKKGKYLGVPLAMPMPGAVHYYRFGSQDDWKVYQTMSTSMNLVTEVMR